jgi:cellulose synthase/poly-beta-1,6-N-acetylglucosamine synthase-like glycosyltransferase
MKTTMDSDQNTPVMKVKTADAAGVSLRKALLYGLTATALVAALTLPALVSVAYERTLRTVLLVLLLGLVGRTYVGSLLAFARTDPPEALPDDLPLVSIVIPAFNEEPVLADTIEAALDVDYPRDLLEIVVCYEAASTDRTGEIAERYGAEYAAVKAVERDEPGGGKAKATNYALGYATGDVIASIDADHQFDPAAVERAVRWFHADPEIWCVKGRCYGRNPTDSLLALHATVERHIAELADLFGRQVFGGFTIFGGGQAFFRAELFDELGPFDEEVLVEDIDMSARIHAHGKRLQVDPYTLTYEENPATLSGWWSQRSRWARGWMQVAVRHLIPLSRDRTLSLRERADAVYTFSYALLPVLLVLVAPLFVLDRLVLDGGTYLPYDTYLWTAIGLGPVVCSSLIFARDYREGYSHHPAEYLAAITLWFYFFFQSFVYVAAFLDEFVFDRESVYVTTSRSGSPDPEVERSPTDD